MHESHTEEIKIQMARTRSALAEKIETLETTVAGQVERTGAAVEGTVDKVLGTVENATATVEDTIAKVSSTVGGAIDSLKEHVSATEQTFKSTMSDIRERISLACMVRRRPWLMMGGAALAGFWLDQLLERRNRRPDERQTPRILRPSRLSAQTGQEPRGEEPRQDESAAGEGRETGQSEHGSALGRVVQALRPHVAQLQGLAVGSLMSLIRDVTTKSLTDAWRGPIAEAIDDLTRELGGKPSPRGQNRH